jgi:putative ABC transport system permease protein
MVNHLFKLLWKKRKSNFLIMLEIFVAFIIVFAVSSLSVYSYRNYAKPTGIKIDNVWTVYVNFNVFDDSLNHINADLLYQKVKAFKEVEAMSFTSTPLYGHSTSSRGFEHNGKNIQPRIIHTDENYPSVLGIELTEGRWFNNTDTIQKYRSVVINQHLKEELFGKEEAIGKVLGKEGDEKRDKVVGVVGNLKIDSDFQPDMSLLIEPVTFRQHFLVKTTPSVSADFEAQFAKSLRQLGENWEVEILHDDNMKADKNNIYLIPQIILFIVCGFLIVNVAFGLFGVLFQNINRRRGEIGIRRAMGATKGNILSHFIGEMIVLATFAIALGVFFAVQFPLLNIFDVAASVYVSGIVIAILAVYGLVFLCSWFPSLQAAKIYPAMALHED